MTTQKVVTFLVVVVLLVAGLGAVNSYYVKPAMAPQMPMVEPLPSGGDKSPAVDANIVAATLENIRSVQTAQAKQEPFQAREVSRNPFLWPGENVVQQDAAAPVAEADQAVEQQPKIVRLILIGQNKKVALINDEFVKEGAMFQGSVVQKIEKNAVVLRGASGSERLPLGEMSYAFLAAQKNGGQQVAADMGMPAPAGMPLGDVGGGAPSAAQQEAVQRLMERLTPLMTQPAAQ